MKRFISFFITLVLVITTGAFEVSAKEKISLNISSGDESVSISDKLYGAFIEDISYACDGGLVSNLVNNNSFEYEFNKTTAWKSSGLASLETASEEPMNKSNPTYAVITADGNASITNLGYTELYKYKTYEIDEKIASTPDMGFKADVKYDFSCYINNQDFDGTISVYLDSDKNRNNITQISIENNARGVWSRIDTTLTSNATEDGGLTIEFNGNGTLYIDFVMLVSQDSYGYGTQEWKYTTLRNDLFTALKQMNPAFIRFPGGCLAEGDSLENLYDWKETIGPLEEREQFYNLWKDDVGRDYINTMAMGYHEYFQLCSDIGAEPIPILNVGLTCQGRCAYDDYVIALKKTYMSDDEWEKYLTQTRNIAEENTQERDNFTDYINGLNIKSQEDFEAYLDTIALRPGTKEWEAYVQDILDLIEYANGDSTTTYWGALRAANGSTQPFNLKYIGLGNENWGEVYERNFKELYKEIKKVYPDITVISSAGNSLEGDAYDDNMSWINEDYSDTIVDEHYYTRDGYLFDHNDRYDSFDREQAHIFVGEYAATAKGVGTLETKSNMLEAVEEASYLTGIERNGDVVDMTSYAPTFAKVNAQCWDINLIWFDSQEIVLTPSYYVQMLFSNNCGTKYLKSVFDNGTTVQNGIYESVTVDEKNEVLYIKLVNASGKSSTVDVNLTDFGSINRVSAQSLNSSYKSACNEIGRNTTFPEEYDLNVGSQNTVSVDMNKYDVTVLRVAYGSNNGDTLYSISNNLEGSMASPSAYLPAAVKGAVAGASVGAVVIIAAAAGIAVLIKKKKSKKNDN
ncbi:MAG: alpha-L-arabinofuranosidase C-terminal domain-containing protein [Eubacterium sp.]